MSTLKADTIQSTSGGVATLTSQTAAKSFGNIELGSTLVESFNQSTFTDNGTGDYTFNFTNNMANKNHVTTANNMRNATGGYGHTAAYGNPSDTSSTTGSARQVFTNILNNFEDMRRCMTVTNGDLA
tara:strand:- start:495 stop:875 length:381 start_codon:yes stop_codon:yes gene_type:complete